MAAIWAPMNTVLSGSAITVRFLFMLSSICSKSDTRLITCPEPSRIRIPPAEILGPPFDETAFGSCSVDAVGRLTFLSNLDLLSGGVGSASGSGALATFLGT